MDTHLKILLVLGWFSGCFPVKSPRNLQYSWKHPIFIYSIILLLLYLSAEISFMKLHKQAVTTPLSQLIMEYLVSVNAITACVILRIWKLLRCSQLTNLIMQVIYLKQEAGYKKRPYIFRYYFLGHLIFVTDFIPTAFLIYQFTFTNETSNFFVYRLGSEHLDQTNIVRTGFVYRMFVQSVVVLTRYFSLAIIAFIGVHLLYVFENFCFDLQTLYCHEAVSNVHIIEDDEEEDVEEDSKDDVSSEHNMEDFEDQLPAVFGNYWTNASQNEKQLRIDEFEAKVTISKVTQEGQWATNVTRLDDVYSLKDLSDRFLQIQKAFNDYNKVAGVTFFVLICQATISLIHKLYSVASSEFAKMNGNYDLIRFLSKSIVGFMVVSGLSHLGEIITTRMRKWKEQLKCVMLNELLCEKSHDSTNTLTESVVKWNWGLSALNLFNINHALLPAIAGTMVTYLIVIIQLKVSESSSSENSTLISNTADE